jgi:hypothetical protein
LVYKEELDYQDQLVIRVSGVILDLRETLASEDDLDFR